MKTVVYRRAPGRQPKAVAVARVAPRFSTPGLALALAAALTLIVCLALRGFL